MRYDKRVWKMILWMVIVSVGFCVMVITSVFPPLAALIVIAGIRMKDQFFHDETSVG